MAALELPYEHYVAINGGEHCGICGRRASGTRRLDRDHDHKTGVPRGLLCFRHNKGLEAFSDRRDLLLAAADYLQRATLDTRSDQAYPPDSERPPEGGK